MSPSLLTVPSSPSTARPPVGWRPASRPPAVQPPPDQALVLLRPPYDRPEHLAGWSTLDAARATPGVIAGIRLDRAERDPERLGTLVRELRQRSPATPVVLFLQLPMEESVFVTAQATRMRVRAIVCAGQPVEHGLRRSLTQTPGLAEDVVEWLGLCGVRLSPLVAHLVEQLFRYAPLHQDLTGLLERIGVAETSARFRMQKKRLPPPSRWFQAARALHAALRIQAEPDTPLLRIAHQLGYSDHSALSQLVHRAFRVRPSAIRGTLGWEWLLARWVPSLARR